MIFQTKFLSNFKVESKEEFLNEPLEEFIVYLIPLKTPGYIPKRTSVKQSQGIPKEILEKVAKEITGYSPSESLGGNPIKKFK